jgi:hypothetical protein
VKELDKEKEKKREELRSEFERLINIDNTTGSPYLSFNYFTTPQLTIYISWLENKVLRFKFEYERDLIRMEVKHGN